MWTHSISLPRKKETVQNKNGFEEETWEFIQSVPASIKDATRTDELLAHQAGYEASVIVELMACNYGGSSFFIDDATKDVYDVRRTHTTQNGMRVVLTGEKREHGKI